MNQKTVAVLFGAVSSEYEVSLRSAASVLRNFPKDRYEVVMLGITKDGRWLEYTGPIEEIEKDQWHQGKYARPAILSPDRSHHGYIRLDDPTHPIRLDIVFPVMHGEHAEDGTIQGLLEVAGIPFVGCGVLASAACMDKAFTHTLLESAGVAMAPWAKMFRWELGDLGERAPEWEKNFGYPMFVKPANTGSSVGVEKVRDRISLLNALKTAFRYDRKAIIEKAIVGKELECAVLGNYTGAAASVIGEIVPHHDFYDYEGKYLDNSTDLYIPARISQEDSERIRKTAIQAFQVMGCTGLCRVDFFLTEEGQVLLNEMNTIPGFTSISMYSKLFEATGISYSELIARLLALASEQESR